MYSIKNVSIRLLFKSVNTIKITKQVYVDHNNINWIKYKRWPNAATFFCILKYKLSIHTVNSIKIQPF